MTTDATETMNYPRINPAVSNPVCTPVLPVAYGNAAGHARLAPPAFAPSKRTVHRLASGGIIAARVAARNNARNMMRALAPQQGAGSQVFRPNEILPAGLGAVRWRPGASTAVSTQAAAWRKYAQTGTDRLSRVRNGCYSHTPPV